MDVQVIINFVNELAVKFPWAVWILAVLSILGSLVVVAQAIVAVTPSKKDDEVLAKVENNSIGGFIFKLLTAFAPVKKK